MSFNEQDFLPIWLAHYGSQFGYENLFVIDDGSSDRSIQDSAIKNLVSRKRMPLDEDQRALLVSYFCRELLGHYELIMYADVDELLVVDPGRGVGLRDYLAKNSDNYFTTVGLNVLQDIRNEGPLDMGRPLFEQRQYVQFDIGYCKTLASRVPLKFASGFHTAGVSPNFHNDLYLFHLRAADVDIARRRLHNLNRVRFSDNSVRKKHGLQFRMNWSQYKEKFFGTTSAAFGAAPAGFKFSAAGEWKKTGGIKTGYVGPLAKVPERFASTILLSDGRLSPETGTLSEVDVAKLWNEAIRSMVVSNTALWRGNDLCPCGSGRKIESCHHPVQERLTRAGEP